MLTPKERLELDLLGVMASQDVPIGSGTLTLLLKERQCETSAATIGRMLSEMDHTGITLKLGYKGRLLTKQGEKRLTELRNRDDLAKYSSRFYETVDAESKSNLLNILTARRGIEREAARLAAINATEEDIEHIRDIFRRQNEYVERGEISADQDVVFHQAVARASKNDVLAAAYDFIWQNGKFSPVMEYIRISVGGKMAVDHNRILEAIILRDAVSAEQLMVKHIDGLIDDANKYWSLAQRKRKQKAE